MRQLEELMNAELDVLVAKKAMGWVTRKVTWLGVKYDDIYWYDSQDKIAIIRRMWHPSTNIAHAFQVDKPEWWWSFEETDYDGNCQLITEIFGQAGQKTAVCSVPLDPANKTAAYCRGRILCALKACGVEEV